MDPETMDIKTKSSDFIKIYFGFLCLKNKKMRMVRKMKKDEN